MKADSENLPNEMERIRQAACRDKRLRFTTLWHHVYLYGSRAHGNNRWNSDYDLWIDGEISGRVLSEIIEELEESFVHSE